MPGEAPQMTVKYEARLFGESVFDRMKFHSIPILRDSIQRFIPTVDLNPSDLRVRHPKRLSQMFDGLLSLKLNRNWMLPLCTGQKVPQPAVK